MKTAVSILPSKPRGSRESGARKVRFLCPTDTCVPAKSRRTSLNLGSNPQTSPTKQTNARSGGATPPTEWTHQRSSLRFGTFEARLEFKPKKRNGHPESHPWQLSLYSMRGEKTVGVYCPLSRNFKNETEAKTAGREWIDRRGCR